MVFKSRFKKKSRRKFSNKKTTLKKVVKKIDRLKRELAPTYHTVDDMINRKGSSPIPITGSQIYKYPLLPFGALASQGLSFNQGVQEGDMIGNTFMFHSLSLKLSFYSGPLQTVSSVQIRCIIFWDNDPIVVDPVALTFGWNFPSTSASQEILSYFDGTTQNASAGPYNGFYNPSTVGKGKRYKIFYDKLFKVTIGQAGTVTTNVKIPIRKNVMAKYNDTAVNKLYPASWPCIMFISDQTLSAQQPFCDYTARICYSL